MIKRPFDGKLIGYNIDYMGAIAAIEEGLLQGLSVNQSYHYLSVFANLL